jgi:hypothetical protein
MSHKFQFVSNSHEGTAALTEWQKSLLRHTIAGEPYPGQLANADVPSVGDRADEIALRRLDKTDTLGCVSPPGAPRSVYPDHVCAVAVEVLRHHRFNLTQLLDDLREHGIIKEGCGCVDRFSARLREYCKKHKIHINTTCRTSTFLIRERSKKERVLKAAEARALLRKVSLEDIVFVDETQCNNRPGRNSECG